MKRNNRVIKSSTGRTPGFNNRRGSAFLTAMFFLVVLLGLGTVFIKTSTEEMQRASRIRKETRALALAEAGLDYMAWRIYNETPTTAQLIFDRSFPEGSFHVATDSYQDASGHTYPHAFLITSTGASQGFQSEIKAVGQYMVTNSTNNAIFDNALFSGIDMSLTGSPKIDGDVYSNGNINIKSNSVTITGKASAAGWIKDTHNRIAGAKNQYYPKIAMPVVDLQYYLANAATVYTGGYTFSSSTHLDGITYVEGDIHLSGQVSGKGVIVCTGDVYIDGNVTLASGSDEFAVISTGNVRINGTCDIYGVIYAHDADIPTELVGNGTANVYGAIITDTANMKGTINVHYRKPTVPLPGGEADPIQVDVVSWRRIK
jgi:cytoskeletal protein CcmA (bactofilin family)